MTSNTDSTLFVYLTEHIRVKGYLARTPGNGFSLRTGMHSLDHHVEEWTLVVEGKEPIPGGGKSQAPQHFLSFFPLPHGHRSLRPIFGLVTLVVATLRDEWMILRKEMIERGPELGTADAFEAMSVEIRSLFDTFRADRPKRYQQHYWKMVFAPNRLLATPLMMEKLSDRALDAILAQAKTALRQLELEVAVPVKSA